MIPFEQAVAKIRVAAEVHGDIQAGIQWQPSIASRISNHVLAVEGGRPDAGQASNFHEACGDFGLGAEHLV